MQLEIAAPFSKPSLPEPFQIASSVMSILQGEGQGYQRASETVGRLGLERAGMRVLKEEGGRR